MFYNSLKLDNNIYGWFLTRSLNLSQVFWEFRFKRMIDLLYWNEHTVLFFQTPQK